MYIFFFLFVFFEKKYIFWHLLTLIYFDMKKTKFLLFVFLSVAPSVVLSQGFSLLSNTSLPRSGDEIVKSQVSFCAPGDIGDSIVWNFQDLEFLNSRQDLFYTGRLDSVLCRYLQGSVYRYTLSQSQDTLLFLGYENPTSHVSFVSPVPILRFPFSYGDSLSTSFVGIGGYSHTYALKVYGNVHTAIDACGLLILPGPDTLCNVMRLHRKEIIGQQFSSAFQVEEFPDSLSVEAMLQDDSVTWQVDTYQWYLPGYRYPILETMENTVFVKDISKQHYRFSSLFSPEEQRFLNSDEENVLYRDPLYRVQNEDKNNSSNELAPISIQCDVDRVNHIATLRYNLTHEESVEILLVNISGVVLYYEPTQKKWPGFYSSEIDFHNFGGNEFILSIIIGDKKESWKITK